MIAAACLGLSYTGAALLLGSFTAAVFCGVVLIHESGHYAVARLGRLHRSGPLVIFPLGGVVLADAANAPRPARATATLIAGGPIAGALGAWSAAFLWWNTHSLFWLAFAHASVWLNLANLIPIGPLDGGRLAEHAQLPPFVRLAVTVYAATTGLWSCVVILVALALHRAAPSVRFPQRDAKAIAIGSLSLLSVSLWVLATRLPSYV